MVIGWLNDSDMKIRVHHVGEMGGCGPIKSLRVFGKQAALSLRVV